MGEGTMGFSRRKRPSGRSHASERAGPGTGLMMLGLVVASGLGVRPVAAQDAGPVGLDRIEHYVERLQPFGFSGAVIVGTGDGPQLVRGFGQAHRDEGRPYLPSTVATIGSITKSFTAAAVMRLQEMGRLSPSDAIAAYLPGVPDDKASITIHQLLTHTSGLKRNGPEGGDFNLGATRSAVLEDALSSPLEFAPGARFSYSNLGYSLLGMIVENASDLPYEKFVARNVLRPARMYRTGYVGPYYHDEELAHAYRDGEELGPVIRQPMLPDGPTWNLRANGGLHSNPYDMYRWFIALRDGNVLSPESTEAMTRRQASQPGGGTFYGYGFDIAVTSRGTRDVSHAGGNGFFAVDFHWFPDEDVMFFVTVNEDSRVNMARLSDAIEAMFFGAAVELPPLVAPVSAETLESMAGTYVLPSNGTVLVTASGESLHVVARGDAAMQVVLGGALGTSDPLIGSIAGRSAEIVRREFGRDFRPKFDAMGGAVPIASLARYHGYDREYWDAEFGSLEKVTAVAAAGTGSEVRVVIRIEFARGAAGQIHTWREGRLANVSVVTDWRDVEVGEEMYPVGDSRFESFDQGSLLRLTVEVQPPRSYGGQPSLVFLAPDGRVVAKRVGPSPPTSRPPILTR